jgi:hypothetical protein
MEDLKRRETEVERLRAKKRGRKQKLREIEAQMEMVKAERNSYVQEREQIAK